MSCGEHLQCKAVHQIPGTSPVTQVLEQTTTANTTHSTLTQKCKFLFSKISHPT